MELTHRAGTGDSVSQILRNLYPSDTNFARYFYVHDTLLVKFQALSQILWIAARS